MNENITIEPNAQEQPKTSIALTTEVEVGTGYNQERCTSTASTTICEPELQNGPRNTQDTSSTISGKVSTYGQEQPCTSTASCTILEGQNSSPTNTQGTIKEQQSTATSTSSVNEPEESNPDERINPLNLPAKDSLIEDKEILEIPKDFEWIEKLPKQLRDEMIIILKHGLSDTERQAIYNQYPIPEHLKKLLLPPKVNPEIWALMPSEAKYYDLSMCHIHQRLAKVVGQTVIGLGLALNSVSPKLKDLEQKEKFQSILQAVTNLISNSSEDCAKLGTSVTQGRREMIMEFLNPEAKEEAKFTTADEFLFGKDFQNGRTSHMMKKIKGPIRTKRFRARR